MRVLFLLPYPLSQAPSQRFRVEAYFDLLTKQGIAYTTSEFLDQKGWENLYKKGSLLQKTFSVIKGFWKRAIVTFFKAGKYDYIFIHREAAPLGPPLFEWWLAKVKGKKIIYDFDDAIWVPLISEGNNLARSVKCFWKIKRICQWSYKVSAGNAYLARWAGQYNPQVVINPTCVDMLQRYNSLKEQLSDVVTIGWTGSHSTLKYLDRIFPVIRKLETEHAFTFLVICNQPPLFELSSLQFIKWREATEIDDLLKINIGIMPLENDAWSEGKCGFKLIQYLSLGIPAVASPVGINKQIVEEGINGYLCQNEAEWETALKKLLVNTSLRTTMGAAGHHKMKDEYSIGANAGNFLSLFS